MRLHGIRQFDRYASTGRADRGGGQVGQHRRRCQDRFRPARERRPVGAGPGDRRPGDGRGQGERRGHEGGAATRPAAPGRAGRGQRPVRVRVVGDVAGEVVEQLTHHHVTFPRSAAVARSRDNASDVVLFTVPTEQPNVCAVSSTVRST